MNNIIVSDWLGFLIIAIFCLMHYSFLSVMEINVWTICIERYVPMNKLNKLNWLGFLRRVFLANHLASTDNLTTAKKREHIATKIHKGGHNKQQLQHKAC